MWKVPLRFRLHASSRTRDSSDLGNLLVVKSHITYPMHSKRTKMKGLPNPMSCLGGGHYHISNMIIAQFLCFNYFGL